MTAPAGSTPALQDLTLTEGHVLCPPCSGTGRKDMKPDAGSTTTQRDPHARCRLCLGEGEVPEERAEAFWNCVARHGKVVGKPETCATALTPCPEDIDEQDPPVPPPHPLYWAHM
jgi:hypothetical protein